MAAFNRLDQWPQDLATAVHNLNTAALNVMLTNTALVAANAVRTILPKSPRAMDTLTRNETLYVLTWRSQRSKAGIFGGSSPAPRRL